MSKFRGFGPQNTLLLHGKAKGQQGALSSAAGKLIIYAGDGEGQPFIMKKCSGDTLIEKCRF
jgi:hypothetical protein